MRDQVQQGIASTPILATKYQVPPARSGLVPRPHLLERLSQGLAGRVTAIAAPAGFGKTTLLCQWHRQIEVPMAWLSLDEGDDDLVRFWSYLITALQTIDPTLGQDSLAMLRGLHSNRVPIESVLARLMNDVEHSEAGDRILLVLDDFHLITAKPTLDSLTFLISHQPRRLHLILSGRSDPALPLGRLRAGHQLAELRASDLRFTQLEARRFFRETMGLDLLADQVALLETTSEGWVAGMQLAGLSVQGRHDPAAFINAFAGSNRYVIDYLMEEVLNQQPDAVRSFLLHTSVLERMTASLCNAVALAHDGQTMLEYLDKANLFVTPLDDERCCYRYHRLFGEFLRHHLRHKEPDLVPVLQLRAAEWCEQNGLKAEAIDFALEARDFAKAASLLESTARATLLSGDIPRLLRWYEAMPREMLRTLPHLCLLFAWGLALQGQMSKSEQILDDIESGLNGHEDGLLLGGIAAARADLACARRQTSEALEMARRALDLLPPDSHAERGAVLLEVGSTYSQFGEIDAAGRTFAEAVTVNEEANNRIGAVLALGNLAGIQIVQGRLHEAVSTSQRALQWAIGTSGAYLPHASVAYLNLAAASYERDDLEAARQQAIASLELGRQRGNPAHEALCRTHLARLAMADGDWSEAERYLHNAAGVACAHNLAEVESKLAAGRLRLLANRGQVEEAVLLSQERGLDLNDSVDPTREAEYVALTWVTVLSALKRLHTSPLWQAVRLLEGMCQRAEAGGRLGNAVEVRAMWALALYAMGESARATVVLQQTLALAKREGFVRTFVDLGPIMADLLRQVAAREDADDYIPTLLEACARDATRREVAPAAEYRPRPSPRSSVGLVETLSDREIEVLRLVASGRSNQEIADTLILAVGTVKRHLNNIFGKMGAGSRLQAVAQARDLGLL